MPTQLCPQPPPPRPPLPPQPSVLSPPLPSSPSTPAFTYVLFSSPSYLTCADNGQCLISAINATLAPHATANQSQPLVCNDNGSGGVLVTITLTDNISAIVTYRLLASSKGITQIVKLTSSPPCNASASLPCNSTVNVASPSVNGTYQASCSSGNNSVAALCCSPSSPHPPSPSFTPPRPGPVPPAASFLDLIKTLPYAAYFFVSNRNISCLTDGDCIAQGMKGILDGIKAETPLPIPSFTCQSAGTAGIVFTILFRTEAAANSCLQALANAQVLTAIALAADTTYPTCMSPSTVPCGSMLAVGQVASNGTRSSFQAACGSCCGGSNGTLPS